MQDNATVNLKRKRPIGKFFHSAWPQSNLKGQIRQRSAPSGPSGPKISPRILPSVLPSSPTRKNRLIATVTSGSDSESPTISGKLRNLRSQLVRSERSDKGGSHQASEGPRTGKGGTHDNSKSSLSLSPPRPGPGPGPPEDTVTLTVTSAPGPGPRPTVVAPSPSP